MTVAELMRALEAYDPEAEVLVDHDGVHYPFFEMWRDGRGRAVIT
jgi:hypothetical protein